MLTIVMVFVRVSLERFFYPPTDRLPYSRGHHIRAVLADGHQASVSRGQPISLELSAVECEC